MAKVEIQRTDEIPICPHCEKQLPTILATTSGTVTVHTIYLCPHCKKVLGISIIP